MVLAVKKKSRHVFFSRKKWSFVIYIQQSILLVYCCCCTLLSTLGSVHSHSESTNNPNNLPPSSTTFHPLPASPVLTPRLKRSFAVSPPLTLGRYSTTVFGTAPCRCSCCIALNSGENPTPPGHPRSYFFLLLSFCLNFFFCGVLALSLLSLSLCLCPFYFYT